MTASTNPDTPTDRRPEPPSAGPPGLTGPTGPGTAPATAVDRAQMVAWWLAGWSLAYASYRAYYAAGGRFAVTGHPVSQAQFQQVNAVGAGIIVICSVAGPLVMVRVGLLRRRLLPVAGWAGAVGCCMHALVDTTLRIFSLTGVHPTQLPASFWRSYDRHGSDLQDLLFNEPWFLVNGLLWGALTLTVVPAARARWWLTSAVLVVAPLSTYGVLRGLDVIGPTPLG